MPGQGAEESGESCLLVSVQLPDVTDEETADSLQELASLARTAGARVLDRQVQKRTSFNPSTVLGKGKVQQIRRSVEATGADLVIFDDELTITQQDRLASDLDTRVIDRTALILDIFAQHAHTREGAVQVELAQLSYLLPRIRGLGVELSRLGAGIGTRGPGETKLEVDRRRIRRRIRKLEKDLEQMEAVRRTQRKQRVRAGLPSICLVGYTNSGKSSLLNRLTGASVLVEDQLFSTLDSTTRRLQLPDRRKVVVSDTVGFIRKLPHELVAAFRSTLEVVRSADMLIHMVDATREDEGESIDAVNEVLDDLGSSQIPCIVALNKIDSVEQSRLSYLKRAYTEAIPISALTSDGVEQLLGVAADLLGGRRTVTMAVPGGEGEVIASLYREGSVISREFEDDKIVLLVSLPSASIASYSAYLADDARKKQ